MKEIKLIDENGKRNDGRGREDLRDIKIQVGIISEADGSAYIEWGGNKILCAVYGPTKCIPRHMANPEKARIKCRYMMSPFASLEEHGRSGPSRRSTELSMVIRQVFENVLILEKFPNTQIELYLDVLQANGGTRTTSITAASVALANAGIPMKDMVSAVAVGKAGGEVITDLNKYEDNLGESDIPIAFSHRNKEILLLQMDGLLTKEELSKAMDMAEKAAENVYGIQEDSLKKFYEVGEEDFNL